MYENWTISNQNKNVEFIFGHRILINYVFVKSSSKAPTGADRKTQKEKKRNYGLILHSKVAQNLEYDVET